MSTTEPIDRFLTAKLAAGRSERTIEFYQLELTFAAKWFEANGTTLEGADAGQIEMHLAAERKRGQGQASVDARYRALSAFYNWRHRRDKLPGDPPISDVERPGMPDNEPRRTTPDEIEQVLSAIPIETWVDLRDRSIIRITFWSGLRVSEVAGLRVADIDQTERRLHIRRGKGGKPRMVPFHPSVMADLVAYLFARPDHTEPMLWIADNGAGGSRGALQAGGVRQMMTRRCKAAGVRRINPHALRHGFAMTMLNEGGVTMDAVAKMMGHSDPSVTRRFYAHYLDDEIANIYEDAIARTRKRKGP